MSLYRKILSHQNLNHNPRVVGVVVVRVAQVVIQVVIWDATIIVIAGAVLIVVAIVVRAAAPHVHTIALEAAQAVLDHAIHHVITHVVEIVKALVEKLVPKDARVDALVDVAQDVKVDALINVLDAQMRATAALEHATAAQIIVKGAHLVMMHVIPRAWVNVVAHVLLNAEMHARMVVIWNVWVVVK